MCPDIVISVGVLEKTRRVNYDGRAECLCECQLPAQTAVINNTWPHTRRWFLCRARDRPAQENVKITAECGALQEKKGGGHCTKGQGTSEWASRLDEEHSAVAVLVFTSWQYCEDMKLHLGWCCGRPCCYSYLFLTRKTKLHSVLHILCLAVRDIKLQVGLPGTPVVLLSECNLCWQKASAAIRSLSVASSNAPPQTSPSSSNSIQIADALGAQPLFLVMNRLDYLVPKPCRQ